MVSIIDLPQIVGALQKEERELFERFFKIRISQGELKLPKEMTEWADKTFGDHKLLEKQKIVLVMNLLTNDDALFNEIRAKRPITALPDENTAAAIKESEGDNFCHPLTGTPSDVFGRAKGKYCITASNVAKYDALHGLVIFKKHNPLDFNEKEIQDYYSTAHEWFRMANKYNRHAKYPFILWNCLWKAGASMVHGHMQMVLGEQMHYADAEFYNKLRVEYSKNYNSKYFSDLFKVHNILGLGIETKHLKIFCSITPKKEREITIIGPELDKEFVFAIYASLRTLIKDFGTESFNVGVIMPPLHEEKLLSKKHDPAWIGFPVYARIVDRGKLSSKTTDMAGMEMLESTTVVETDPFVVIEKLREKF